MSILNCRLTGLLNFCESHWPGMFVPAFVVQPLFQTLQLKLRVTAAKLLYVRLVTVRIEPLKRLSNIFAQLQIGQPNGDMDKSDIPFCNAAEGLGFLKVGLSAASWTNPPMSHVAII